MLRATGLNMLTNVKRTTGWSPFTFRLIKKSLIRVIFTLA